jgi:hypothetical protein
LVKTPAELASARAPGPFDFGAEYPMHLLVFMIGIVYAPIAPFLLVFVVVFFLIGTVVFRYLFCFVFKSEYESGGSLFPKVFARIVVAMLLGHLTLIGQLALKNAPTQSALLIPLPVATVVFYVLVNKTLGSSAQRLSREEIVVLDAATADNVDVESGTKATSSSSGVDGGGGGGGDGVDRGQELQDEPMVAVSYVHPRLCEKPVNADDVISKLEQAFPQLCADMTRTVAKKRTAVKSDSVCNLSLAKDEDGEDEAAVAV